MTWRLPLDKYKLGPAFGVVDSWHPNGHRGTDYNGFKSGYALKAVNDGVVTLNKFSKILGNVVVIKTDKYYWGYSHLVAPSPLAVGTKVKSGQIIGNAGTTGSASSGVHLHFTLSLLPEGVFGGKVYDGHAFLLKAIARQRPVTKPAVINPVKLHCPTCKCKDTK